MWKIRMVLVHTLILLIDRECYISYDNLKGCSIATLFLSVYSYAYLDTSRL